jgi:hypothetical protein
LLQDLWGATAGRAFLQDLWGATAGRACPEAQSAADAPSSRLSPYAGSASRPHKRAPSPFTMPRLQGAVVSSSASAFAITIR